MLFLWFQATVLGIGLAPPVAEGNNNNTLCYVLGRKLSFNIYWGDLTLIISELKAVIYFFAKFSWLFVSISSGSV